MSVTGIKKTLNLHKYSVRVNKIVLNWKIILPVGSALLGLIIGCTAAKGEGVFYSKVVSLFISLVLNAPIKSLPAEIVRLLLIPSIFAFLLFFTGLSAFGGFTANAFPLGFTYLAGMISYYMYSTYTLKGLAYCVILIFPYAVLSAAGIILCAGECMNMSELMLRAASGSNKINGYSFRLYCTRFLKGYIVIIAGAAVKYLLSILFIGLFTF